MFSILIESTRKLLSKRREKRHFFPYKSYGVIERFYQISHPLHGMIHRFADNLSDQQVKELSSRLKDRKITNFEYDKQGADNYFVLGFDDETKLTIFYESGKGSLILGEGFP